MKSRINDELRIRFNDICMRELNLDVTEDNQIFDIKTQSILEYKDGVTLVYYEQENQYLRPNQYAMNLLENPRLLNILTGIFLESYSKQYNVYFTSLYTTNVTSITGYAACTKLENGVNKEIRSAIFMNESVRLLHLICTLKHTTNLYNFNMFDVM